jgi:hypothetical protein
VNILTLQDICPGKSTELVIKVMNGRIINIVRCNGPRQYGQQCEVNEVMLLMMVPVVVLLHDALVSIWSMTVNELFWIGVVLMLR